MYDLYPKVKKITYADGYFEINKELSVFFTDKEVNVFTKLNEILKINEVKNKNDANFLFINDNAFIEEEYKIIVCDKKIEIKALDGKGFYLALTTLEQIVKKDKDRIHNLEIHDYPDMKIRGLMVDISRNKVPTVKTIKEIIDLMSKLKMNHLELYVEGFSFEYDKYKEYLKKDGYITKCEYQEIEKYANSKYIDLVPNENGFGHMGDWLKHDEFKHLAECPEGIFLWGRNREPSTLNPLDDGSIELVKDLYDEMLPISNSKYFNMNFDEPFELGKGKSKGETEIKGLGNVYIDYTLKAYDALKKYGKTPLIWMDVLLNHKDLLNRLPEDMIYVDWGYDSFYSFEKNLSDLKKTKVIAAPGTSSWCSFLGRQEEAFETIRNACKAIKDNNGLGILLTDWGDFGHLQFLPISYPSIVYCALLSWTYKEGTYREVKEVLNNDIFEDENKLMAELLMDLARYNRYDNNYRGNGTEAFYTFMWGSLAKKCDKENPVLFFKNKIKDYMMNYERYLALEDFFENKIKELKRTKLRCYDGKLIIDEVLLSIKTIRLINKVRMAYSSEVPLEKKKTFLEEVMDSRDEMYVERKRLWLARNKISDFEESFNHIDEFIKFADETLKYLTRGENYENEN